MPTDLPPAVGIDLGTTFCVVAHLDPAGRPCTIPNSEGDLITPSVVLFDGASVAVGKEAVKAAATEPDRVAAFAKRDMGNPTYSRPIAGQHLPPEVIQSLILEKLKRDAEAKLGPFSKCVITVPAFFNEPRRKATQDAGHLAGLEVIDLINEPTAAAIAYGVQAGFLTGTGEARKMERVLVFDLGGRTFDVTLMEIDGTNYTALATAGDVHLGGIDWDRRIADRIAEQFLAKYPGSDPRLQPAGLQRLLREAEDAKRTLSAREQVSINFEYGGPVQAVAFTPDGRHAVSAGNDRTVRVWDAEDGREVGCLRGHTHVVQDVAVSGDGRLVLSAGDDRTIREWDWRAGSEARRFDTPATAYRVVYQPDGQPLAMCVRNGLVVWDAGRGREVCGLGGDGERITDVSVGPGGGVLATGDEGGTVRAWRIPET